MVDLMAWARSVQNQYIDIDGAAGNQCWDLSQVWAQYLIGPDAVLYTTGNGVPEGHLYLAIGAWDAIHADSWQGEALRKYFTPIPGDQPGQPGDIIIWNYGARLYPISHTAVLVSDQGAMLDTVSQNSSPARPDLPGYSPASSGPSIRQPLAREGIAGFLRPKTTVSSQTNDIQPIVEAFMTTQAEIDAVAKRVLNMPMQKFDSSGQPARGKTTSLAWEIGNQAQILARLDQKMNQIIENQGHQAVALQTIIDRQAANDGNTHNKLNWITQKLGLGIVKFQPKK